MSYRPSFRVVLHETIAYEIYVSARDAEAASDAALDLYDRHGGSQRVGFETISRSAAVHAVQEQRGHCWPRAPMFGIAPCPTTIFTLGVLILAGQSVPLWTAAIPLVWAVIGSTAAVLMNVTEDLGLLAAAALLVVTRIGRPGAGS